jgi:hypothetical protein
VTGTEPASSEETPNDYRVGVHEADVGWDVRIADPAGSVVWTRSCGEEAEARTLASTIQQHLYWLSAEKFREYYKLTESG